MAKIIGISGFISSGKDSIASFLINQYNFKKESFAGTLKDAVANVFGWDREMLEGATKEAREKREQVDQWWAERLNIPNLTPRWVLQQWGTEVCRKNFHDDIWIASLENKLRTSNRDVVISDVRFPNEFNIIKRLHGFSLRVKRGPEPTWYDIAVEANKGDLVAQTELRVLGVHASESSWVGLPFDEVFENDGTLEDLYLKVEMFLRHISVPYECPIQ